MQAESNESQNVYRRPMVLTHQPIRFETSQSWNRGHGPVSCDPGKSNGGHYNHDPYSGKKTSNHNHHNNR